MLEKLLRSPVIPYFTIGLLVVMGCFQYLLYWWEIRKAFVEEEDK